VRDLPISDLDGNLEVRKMEFMKIPNRVKIVEVGPRDGLQNETTIIPSQTKIEFINRLAKTGLMHIEATSFVSPKSIPQLADGVAVMQGITREPGVSYSALVPNELGMENAITAQMNEVAVFTAASEEFCQKNIRCSIAESLERFIPVIKLAKQHKIPIRGYVSCAIACPFSGEIPASQVANVAEQLYKLGCREISLGDTIGVGTPNKVQKMLEEVIKKIPLNHLAVHFHDTYGQALANIYASLEMGVACIDSSVAGLGGCPYAPGASGNVATEDVLYLLHGLGIETGVDLDAMVKVGKFISDFLSRKTQSKVGSALS
jgi:hydroxymethylglutaryl-CoA lyase